MSTVLLRRYERSDLPAFTALFGDGLVMRYVGDGNAFDSAAAATLLEKIFTIYESDPSFFVWAVEEDGEYAGHAELKRRKGRDEYEIIYILQHQRWGRSLGGRVADSLLSHARKLGVPIVIATVYPENAASAAILTRRGFLYDAALSASLEAAAYRLDLDK